MAVKISYAKEKQKLYFLRNPFWKEPRCQDVSPHFHVYANCTPGKPVLFEQSCQKKKRFFLHGRLLRNAIPADPGGGVVFFVDPQGAGSVGVGVVIAVIPWVVSGIFSAGKSCSGYS